jgi:hypothetical protein
MPLSPTYRESSGLYLDIRHSIVAGAAIGKPSFTFAGLQSEHSLVDFS